MSRPPADEPMTLGAAAAAVIRQRLVDLDWDAAVLARRAGLPRSTVWRKLADQAKFDLDTFDRLARALGEDPATLMHEVTAHRALAMMSPDAAAAVAALADEVRDDRSRPPRRRPGAAGSAR